MRKKFLNKRKKFEVTNKFEKEIKIEKNYDMCFLC